MKFFVMVVLLLILTLNAAAKQDLDRIAFSKSTEEFEDNKKEDKYKVFRPLLSYQGLINDENGKSFVKEDCDICFRIYDSKTSNSPIWQETQSLDISDGIINVNLGSVNSLDISFDKQYWVSVEVNGEELPRELLSGSPYSYIAKKLEDGAAVKSLNGMKDNVNIIAGEGIVIIANKAEGITIAQKGGAYPEAFWSKIGDGAHGEGLITPRLNESVQIRNLTVGKTGITDKTDILHITGNIRQKGNITTSGKMISSFIESKIINVATLIVSDLRTKSKDGTSVKFRESSKTLLSTSDSKDSKRMIVADGIGKLTTEEIPQSSWNEDADANNNTLGHLSIGTNIVHQNDSGKKAKLTVAGQIAANSIIVVVDVTQTDKNDKITKKSWPDYVFEEDYDLMELEEIGNFVKANKHLPGVPTRKEVGTNGVNLMEMQHVMLRKIEELTLHMIDMKRENSELRGKLENLDK